MKTLLFTLTLLLSFHFLFAKTDKLVYHFEMKSKSISKIKQLFTPSNEKNNDDDETVVQLLTGKLVLTPLQNSISEQFFEVVITMEHYKLENENGEPLANYFEQSEFTIPFYFKINDKHLISKFYFSRLTSVYAQKVIKELMIHFQFNPYNSEKNMVVKEDNIAGHAKVKYHWISEKAGKITMSKKITEYLPEINEQDQNALSLKIQPNGQTLISYNKQGKYITSISGYEKNTSSINHKTAAIVTQKYSIVLLNTIIIYADDLKKSTEKYFMQKDSLESANIYTYKSPVQILQTVRKQTLGNDNAETLLAMLSHPENNIDSLYLKIRALCTVNPSSAVLFLNALDSSRPGSIAYETIWRGLLHSCNQQGLEVVCSLLSHHINDWQWTKNIVVNIGLDKQCTDNAILSLQNLCEHSENKNISNTAELALGNIVDNLYKINKNKSRQLYVWLIQHLNQKQENEKNDIQKILVLGNTNSRVGYELVKKYCYSNKEAVKNLALQISANMKSKLHS